MNVQSSEADSSSNLVTIFVPTYQNEAILYSCVRSCLGQTYSSIQIVVVDNGYEENKGIVRSELLKFRDDRILYIPNASNIGHQGSFNLIYAMASQTSKFIIIPADVVLMPLFIEKLVCKLDGNQQTQVALAQSVYRSAKLSWPMTHIGDEEKPAFWPRILNGIVNSQDVLKQFYRIEHLRSDWTHFTYIGALVRGELMRSINVTRSSMTDQGAEIYLSLVILSFSRRVYYLREPLYAVYGDNVRLDTARRPTHNYTRYEPIFAELKYLQEFEPLLVRNKTLLTPLYAFVIFKLLYTIVRFPGCSFLLFCRLPSLLLKLLFSVLPYDCSLIMQRGKM